MIKVALSKGYYTIIDKEDAEKVNQFSWFYQNGYAMLRTYEGVGKKRKAIYLHRFINNTPPDKHTDHINGNTLDNRKKNLRTCTIQQNTHNQKVRKGVSKYKGVNYIKETGRWAANIKINMKRIHLKSYKTEEEAALAYNKAAKKYHKEFARLNIIKYEE